MRLPATLWLSSGPRTRYFHLPSSCTHSKTVNTRRLTHPITKHKISSTSFTRKQTTNCNLSLATITILTWWSLAEQVSHFDVSTCGGLLNRGPSRTFANNKCIPHLPFFSASYFPHNSTFTPFKSCEILWKYERREKLGSASSNAKHHSHLPSNSIVVHIKLIVRVINYMWINFFVHLPSSI